MVEDTISFFTCKLLLSNVIVMRKRGDIRAEEKQRVVQLLGEGHSTLEIAKTLGRDHRIIKKVTNNVNKVWTRKTKKFKAKLTRQDYSQLSREVKKNPLQTSKQVFDACGISGVNRTIRCQILSTCSSTKKLPSKPPLTKIHKKKRRASVQYLKHNFSLVLFTDKMWATLDGPDGGHVDGLYMIEQYQLRLNDNKVEMAWWSEPAS